MVLSFITPYGGIEVVQDGETIEIDLQYLVDVIKKLAGLFRIERQSSVGTLPDGSYINRVSGSNGELTWPEYDWPLPVRQYGSIVNFTVFDGFSNSDTFIISWYHYTNNQEHGIKVRVRIDKIGATDSVLGSGKTLFMWYLVGPNN